jgi:hypothetical protein
VSFSDSGEEERCGEQKRPGRGEAHVHAIWRCGVSGVETG